MNNEKIMNSRIQHKYDTAENWGKAVNFIPKAGEIIVYSDGIDGVGVPAIKIGDGQHVVNELEFAGNYYKDLTAEFNAQMEEGNVEEAGEYLLQQSIPGKYCIYDDNGYYALLCCEVNEYNGMFYHTIISYSDDGFKTVDEYSDGILNSTVEHSSGNITYHTPLFLLIEPKEDYQITNKQYVDTSIARIQMKDVTQEFIKQQENGYNTETLYLLSLNEPGKYSIIDSDSITHCEIQKIGSAIFHTITQYTDDGFINTSKYINGESQTITDINETNAGGKTYNKLYVSTVDEDSSLSVVNRDYMNNLIQNLPLNDKGAIIDVVELPAEDIQEDYFYRLLTGSLVFNGFVQNAYTCYCVDGLPETGEPATNSNNTQGNVYFNIQDNELYGYVDNMLSVGLGVPAGWYPANVLLGALGYEYKGVITDITEDPEDSAFRFLLEKVIYQYTGVWTSIESIGRAGIGAGAEVFNHSSNVASGVASHAEGRDATASGIASHAEGENTTASGIASHAEGYGTTASGDASHAEGAGAEASGDHSHAEGTGTKASGGHSHAEGIDTTASGIASHAEGSNTAAYNYASHAEGEGTATDDDAQHVSGKYNELASGYAVIVGNGKSELVRSNAYTLDWNGNAWFAGGITLGGNNKKVLTEGSVGYWGESDAPLPEDISDLTTINASGLYAVTSPMASAFILPELSGGVLEVKCSGTWGKYYLYTDNNGYMARTRTVNNALEPWEWINPPMRPGVEYRTIERHNSQVVYKKMDDNGIILWRPADETEWRNPQQEMINAVLSALPTWEGGSY